MMKLDKRFSGKLTIEVVEAPRGVDGIDDKGKIREICAFMSIAI